ncbi:MAG: hypothetical protein DRH10_00590 [Deltaproteobacteria bacterium]|nr:MAG: hypothetical protein DRH10_00590 [Deltaproteobacteria bacterium]
MSNETKLEDVDLDSLSQEELIKLEDEQVAADAAAGDEDNQEQQQQENRTGADETDKPTDSDEQDKGGGDDEQPEAGGDEQSAVDDEVIRHVSPPKKWAAKRVKQRELKKSLEEANQRASKADDLQAEVTTLKDELASIKEIMASKGMDFPKDDDGNPFSDEKIEEIRDEYGDDLADMMAAAAEIVSSAGKQQQVDTNADKGEQEALDPDFMTAIDDNDELTYWKENSPVLWERAVKADDEFLDADPEYQKLSYAERFKKVVESVKNDVLQNNNAKVRDSGDGGNDIPLSLSGSGGGLHNTETNSAVERVLAVNDPDKQIELYNSLPEQDRDAVDIALGI